MRKKSRGHDSGAVPSPPVGPRVVRAESTSPSTGMSGTETAKAHTHNEQGASPIALALAGLAALVDVAGPDLPHDGGRCRSAWRSAFVPARATGGRPVHALPRPGGSGLRIPVLCRAPPDAGHHGATPLRGRSSRRGRPAPRPPAPRSRDCATNVSSHSPTPCSLIFKTPNVARAMDHAAGWHEPILDTLALLIPVAQASHSMLSST